LDGAVPGTVPLNIAVGWFGVTDTFIDGCVATGAVDAAVRTVAGTSVVPKKRAAFTPRALPVGAVAPNVFGAPRAVVPEKIDALTLRDLTVLGDVPKLAIAPITLVPSDTELKKGFAAVFAEVVGETSKTPEPVTAGLLDT
jgi:hypothetical protein